MYESMLDEYRAEQAKRRRRQFLQAQFRKLRLQFQQKVQNRIVLREEHVISCLSSPQQLNQLLESLPSLCIPMQSSLYQLALNQQNGLIPTILSLTIMLHSSQALTLQQNTIVLRALWYLPAGTKYIVYQTILRKQLWEEDRIVHYILMEEDLVPIDDDVFEEQLLQTIIKRILLSCSQEHLFGYLNNGVVERLLSADLKHLATLAVSSCSNLELRAILYSQLQQYNT